MTESTLRRRQNTRARLIAAAEDVFTAKGLRRVTVDDLVGAAGFSRGAFYSNFSSIEEVFYALFRAQSEQMLDTVRSLLDETPDDEFSIGLLLARLRPLSRSWYVIQTEFTLLALRNEEARVVFASTAPTSRTRWSPSSPTCWTAWGGSRRFRSSS